MPSAAGSGTEIEAGVTVGVEDKPVVSKQFEPEGGWRAGEGNEDKPEL